jgi:tripartite-type tricarboxylate transporter receptor subunit TctC
LEAGFWTGLAAPKNTPVAIIATLNTTVNAGLADPKLKARFANLGDSVSCLASGFSKFITNETEKRAKVIRAANIKLIPEIIIAFIESAKRTHLRARS